MSDVTFVQGDTEPPVKGTLTDPETGGPYDLTNVTAVKFQMRKEDDHRYTVDAAASIVGDPTDGIVQYHWQANDLDVDGEYIAQWELTFSGGGVTTSNPANTITVRRQ